MDWLLQWLEEAARHAQEFMHAAEQQAQDFLHQTEAAPTLPSEQADLLAPPDNLGSGHDFGGFE